MQHFSRKSYLLFIASISLFICQCVFITNVMAKQNIISMEDSYFTPKTISVRVGDTVTWVNKGAKVHTITSDDRSISSGKVTSGQSFSYTFKKPGTYDYYCHQHTFLFMGMKGQVIVK